MIILKIEDLFSKLSYGELSNLAISNSGSGEIIEEKWPQLIGYTNDALTALHSRFLLIEKELILEQVADETRYHLSSRYAEFAGADSGVEHHYIKDQEDDPFNDDLLKVLAVWGAGGQYPLNNADNPYSLFTPRPTLLQVPNPIAEQPLSVIYQAKHPKLFSVPPEEEDNVLDQIIEIPHYLENALQLMIAHKVFSHMNTPENSMKGQEHLAAYEATCLDIEQGDLANQTSQTSHTKLEQRGFV